MRPWSAVMAGLLMISLCVGCRKSPTQTTDTNRLALASFVGIGDLGGGPTNILIVISESDDSLHTLYGSITYRSLTSEFSELTMDSTSDTIRFTYVRNSVTYRVWALDLPFHLDVHVTEPDGVSPFELNRELDGHNLTGYWTGEMTSTLYQSQSSAELEAFQRGSSFTGEAQVPFLETLDFVLSTVTVSGNGFEFEGTMYGSQTYPTLWQGSYVGFDSISGQWAAGESGEIDGGYFVFSRSFR